MPKCDNLARQDEKKEGMLIGAPAVKAVAHSGSIAVSNQKSLMQDIVSCKPFISRGFGI